MHVNESQSELLPFLLTVCNRAICKGSFKEAGESSLARFLSSRMQKAFSELINKALLLKCFQFSGSKQTTRLEKVREAATQIYIKGCNSCCIQRTVEVLTLDDIEPTTIAGCICELAA